MRGFPNAASLVGAVLLQGALATGASAAVVDFEGEALTFYGAGESFTSGGVDFTLQSGFGGGNDLLGVFDAAAPTGNDTQYLTMFNDGAVTASTGGLFHLLKLDYAYLQDPLLPAPTASLAVNATAFDGTLLQVLLDFGPVGGDGVYAFQSAQGAALGALFTTALQSVTFQTCVLDNGGCLPLDNSSQFALDNITVAQVPVPATLALTLLGLAAVAGVSRRRA